MILRPLQVPLPPLSRLINESESGAVCTKCGSSIKRTWPWSKFKGCIQPACINYYKLDLFEKIRRASEQ